MSTAAQADSKTLRPPMGKWAFIAFMSVMCSLSPFAMSFIVPAFPGMAEDFSTSVAQIQFLISVFLIGLGIAQPIHGILADRFGRRPVLLSGFAVFIMASIASVLTQSWTALVVCRFLQAVGVSAGTVTSRAIVNDLQPRAEAAITLSYISIAMGVGPIIAPALGGFMDVVLGWRSIFLGCAAAGIMIFVLAAVRLPETRPANKANGKSFRRLRSDYASLLRSPQFIGYTLMFGFGQGVFFAFLPFAPDYFELVLRQSTAVFVTCWIGLSLAFMAGSFLGTRLTRKFGLEKTIALASIWLLFAAAFLTASYALLGNSIFAATVPLMMAMIGTGIICPLALAGSISVDAKLSATAAGLSSSMGLVIGGLFAAISGRLYDGTLWPYIGLAGLAMISNFLAAKLSAKPAK